LFHSPAFQRWGRRPHSGPSPGGTTLPLGTGALFLRAAWLYPVLVIALAHAGMTLLTWLFFIGAAGSLLVILISFFEDLTELFGEE
jgi:hypothetical protein